MLESSIIGSNVYIGDIGYIYNRDSEQLMTDKRKARIFLIEDEYWKVFLAKYKSASARIRELIIKDLKESKSTV